MIKQHVHTVIQRIDFSNTAGCIELCDCGATRLALPSDYGVTRTGWTENMKVEALPQNMAIEFRNRYGQHMADIAGTRLD